MIAFLLKGLDLFGAVLCYLFLFSKYLKTKNKDFLFSALLIFIVQFLFWPFYSPISLIMTVISIFCAIRLYYEYRRNKSSIHLILLGVFAIFAIILFLGFLAAGNSLIFNERYSL